MREEMLGLYRRLDKQAREQERRHAQQRSDHIVKEIRDELEQLECATINGASKEAMTHIQCVKFLVDQLACLHWSSADEDAATEDERDPDAEYEASKEAEALERIDDEVPF